MTSDQNINDVNPEDRTQPPRQHSPEMRIPLDILHFQKLESLGMLASGMAHDFNNYLMAILGNANLALMTLSPHSPIREQLESISQAAKQASELCRQVMAFNSSKEFSAEPIDLSQTLEEQACLLTAAIPKRILLRYNLVEPLPLISADNGSILQLIVGLVDNAVAAITDRSGTVALSTGMMNCDRAYLKKLILGGGLASGRYVFLEVSDTGRGMTREMLDRIFDPDFSTKHTGWGLGLAAVHEIVRIHAGAIKIYSEAGHGTTIKVLFPVSEDVEPETAAESIEEWRGSGTILLVDDEEHIRHLVQTMLERVGFTVLSAAHGAEAIMLYRELADQITCVLLDLTMPNMDGKETFYELRRIRDNVKVILTSGYREQEVVERFIGKGLAGFIQKPYQMQALVEMVRNVVEE